jgi:hypothetical protein
MHVYEVRPRKDHRSVDLISDALPFGQLWYGEGNSRSRKGERSGLLTRMATESVSSLAPMKS